MEPLGRALPRYASWYIPTAIAMLVQKMSRSRMPLEKLFFADPGFQEPLDTEVGTCFRV